MRIIYRHKKVIQNKQEVWPSEIGNEKNYVFKKRAFQEIIPTTYITIMYKYRSRIFIAK